MELKTHSRLDTPTSTAIVAGEGAYMVHGSNLDNALAYELGVTRFFGIGDIGKRGLINGWAAPEDGHVWNDGPDAELLIAMDVPPRACAVSVEGSPFIKPRQPQQEVTLFANGNRIGFWRFKKDGSQTITGSVEPEHFLVRGKMGVLRLTWHLPNSTRPSEIGEGSDGRELGFVFRSLSITLL